LQNVFKLDTDDDRTNAVLAFALVRNDSDNCVTAEFCNNIAVGLAGSGITISGDSVNLPDGDDKASESRDRVNCAAASDDDLDVVKGVTCCSNDINNNNNKHIINADS
jgi:hypothetical protein